MYHQHTRTHASACCLRSQCGSIERKKGGKSAPVAASEARRPKGSRCTFQFIFSFWWAFNYFLIGQVGEQGGQSGSVSLLSLDGLSNGEDWKLFFSAPSSRTSRIAVTAFHCVCPSKKILPSSCSQLADVLLLVRYYFTLGSVGMHTFSVRIDQRLTLSNTF